MRRRHSEEIEMTALRKLLLVGGLTLSLHLAVQPAFSKPSPDSETAAQPLPRELQKSTSRGLYSEIPVAGVGLPVPAVKPPPVVKPPVNTTVKPIQSKSAPPKATAASLKSSKPATANGKKNGKNKPVTAAGKSSGTAGQTASLGADDNLIPVSHTTGGELVVSARLNKSGASPRYKVGEKLEITVGTSADCSLVVFDYDSNGTLTQIFPNEFQQDNSLRAGESVVIGGADSKFDYEIGGAGGEEKIFVYAYPASSQSPISVAFNPVPQSPFRAAPMTLEQYKDLVNKSKVFFARSVKVVPKSNFKPVSASASTSAPNKLELSFMVDK
jgi:hypothetical protein